MIRRLALTFCYVTAFFTITTAQDQQAPRQNNNWFNMDPDKDRFAGVSTDLTYTELLKGLSPDTVIVAVLDGGTDVRHPDLSAVIWVNEDEIPGNGVDDDQNGYIDDINGWNFLGSEKGNINRENLEITRQYRKYLEAKASGKPITSEMKKASKLYKKEKKRTDIIMNILNDMSSDLTGIEALAGNDSVRVEHVKAYKPQKKGFGRIQKLLIAEMNNGNSYYNLRSQLTGARGLYEIMLNYHLNTGFEARSIIGDDPDNYRDSLYGNNDVIGEDASHGTHVAGIIAAVRDNEIGMNGISDAATIMVLRVVPDGDEYDKDIVNGIRYAVNNGAKIINMSFGKDLSPGKPELDAAFAYAASKDVLIVHASGNESLNIDKNSNYPSPYFKGSKNRIPGWLEVGANAANGYAGNFSNYGKRTVDLFAPGVNIYSTLPDSAYGHENGTSMAAPMVSGVAAILRSYFPQLTAEQVRNILIATVTKVPFDTLKPGSRKKKVGYSELCATAGIINLYKAVKMAQGIGIPK